jgi:glutamyl-tRNA reductase
MSSSVAKGLPKKSIQKKKRKKDLKLIGHMTHNILKNFFLKKTKNLNKTTRQKRTNLLHLLHTLFPKTKPCSLGCSFNGGKVSTSQCPPKKRK